MYAQHTTLYSLVHETVAQFFWHHQIVYFSLYRQFTFRYVRATLDIVQLVHETVAQFCWHHQIDYCSLYRQFTFQYVRKFTIHWRREF